MKKILLTLAALALSAAAFAQDIDFEDLGDLNTIEISKAGSRVETELNLAFPMYFGWTALTNVSYSAFPETVNYSSFTPSSSWLDLQLSKNFVYGLQLADLRIRYNMLDVSLGLRWTFMDFTFSNSDITLAPVNKMYGPSSIKDYKASDYDGKKSKFHASYFGIPLRVGLDLGKVMLYAGGSIELRTNGYTKFKRPKHREGANDLFNPIRATVEGGFTYGGLGVFVMYGLTPLFSDTVYAQANTLTFGLTLGM